MTRVSLSVGPASVAGAVDPFQISGDGCGRLLCPGPSSRYSARPAGSVTSAHGNCHQARESTGVVDRSERLGGNGAHVEGPAGRDTTGPGPVISVCAVDDSSPDNEEPSIRAGDRGGLIDGSSLLCFALLQVFTPLLLRLRFLPCVLLCSPVTRTQA